MEENRKINSEAELVNALCKGVGVETNHPSKGFNWHKVSGNTWDWIKKFGDWNFRYSEPVEVVELWGYYDDETYCAWVFTSEGEDDWHTHKQTQIIQNNKIIWTETKEIKK